MVYIDPGSGSMALQVLLAGALGMLFTLRKRIGGILRSLLGRKH